MAKEAREKKASQGGFAYGSPPFGYKALNAELVIDQQEQEIIEFIRRHRRSGKSTHAIAIWLNNNGYAAKRGGKWFPQSVKRVLLGLKNGVCLKNEI